VHLRVVAPSRSFATLDAAIVTRAVERLASKGLTVSFGGRVGLSGLFDTADPRDRVRDLHEAYADDSVDALITVLGGTRCADVLPLLDWDLIAAHPKPLCGFSDITALLNALWARAGVRGLLGPHFSSWAMEDPGEYQADGFVSMLRADAEVEIGPSPYWADDEWFLPDNVPVRTPSTGWRILREGEARGVAVGGNLSTFRNILRTVYAPEVSGAVLLVEDTAAVDAKEFRRGLQALSLSSGSPAALLIGRFMRRSGITPSLLREVLDSLPAYAGIPCIADVDFGHTQPIATLPVGGVLRVRAEAATASIVAESTPVLS
jgi:muramoyltetrapeptide carboxypeptidase LdcA involved in peptidoglycan recycling